MTGDFGDLSFQAIDCTGINNQTTTKRKYTKGKITNPNTNKLAHSKNILLSSLEDIVLMNFSHRKTT